MTLWIVSVPHGLDPQQKSTLVAGVSLECCALSTLVVVWLRQIETGSREPMPTLTVQTTKESYESWKARAA